MTDMADVTRTAYALLQSCWEDTGAVPGEKGEASWATGALLYGELCRAGARTHDTTEGPQFVFVDRDTTRAGERGKQSTSVTLLSLPVYMDYGVPAGHLELRWARRMEIS